MKTRIGHYDIVTELGRGGMGVVYKGHEAALNRYVAIKVLSPALAHDEGIKERFLREARAMAALNDPHIIQIYFIGEDDGQPYFSMEFVEGESLSTYLKRAGAMSPEQAARAIYQTAQGLAYAHDKGVVHRDIKPANLMLTSRGQIKIADLGIALSNENISKKLTSTGEFVGTPGYLSPEVCTGKVVDQRSDIFSLGIVLFELLTGRMPFTDESPLGLLLEVVRAEIPDVRLLNQDVDEALVKILGRMTAKDPADRYPSCHELVADLQKHPLLASGQTVTAKPVISTAAQTVIGMKTPAPAALAAAAPVTPVSNPGRPTVATPAPPSAPLAAAAPPPAPAVAENTAPGAARPSVLDRQERKSGSSAAWPIAAVLVLGAAAAGAYGFRDRIPFLQSGTAASGTTTATAATSAIAATTAPAAPAPAAATAAPAATGATPAPVTGGTTMASAAPTAATMPAPPPAPAAPATPTPPLAVEAASTAPAAAVASTAAPAPTAPPETGEPLRAALPERDADGVPLAPLRRLAEQRRAAIAKTAPVESAEPRAPAGLPRVAVIAIGDPAITGPAEQLLEQELADRGFLLADESMVPGLEDMIASGRPDLPRLLAALAQRAGVRAVTVIRAEPIGATQLNYYGQSDTLYSVNLGVRSYDTGTRQPVNAGFRSKVDFTALNADFKAREALEPELGRYLGSLSSYRPRGSGG